MPLKKEMTVFIIITLALASVGVNVIVISIVIIIVIIIIIITISVCEVVLLLEHLRIFFRVGLFCIYLLLRVDISSLYRGILYV